MIRLFSAGLRRIPHLELFLDSALSYGRLTGRSGTVTAVAGWGLKKSSRYARRYAEKHGYPYLALEDGFLRSVGLGSIDPPLAIAVDDLGVYYDATRPSRLEHLITQPLGTAQLARARELTQVWRAERVSKYNHLREYSGPLPMRYVLVADQTFGDASIHYGMAAAESFQRMLKAALDENPDCHVVLKIHPDVHAGKKRGHFEINSLSGHSRVTVLAEDVHPVGLIEQAEAVYVVTSQLGFEGLLWGKRVRTFGMPFYAGWGLTQDELPAPERRGNATLEQLTHAALIAYPRYVSPERRVRCEVEEVVAHIGLQRRMRERFPPRIFAQGFSLYKRAIVRRYFYGSTVTFVRRINQVPAGETVAVWGARPLQGLAAGVTVVRLEDGFVRSVGLGADLVQPLSWVMDRHGIYFDSRQPSDLELLLQSSEFTAALVERAGRVRQRLISEGLTKYNVGQGRWRPPAGLRARLILVPGQVESDASIACGSPVIKSNMGLLQAVRAANPGAYVLYKPHPDVVAGLRKSGQYEGAAQRWCDEVISNVPMGELLLQVDEVHTLTSLTGFEALLRGKRVVCYGQPFYAGWGLTQDIHPVGRRTRRLALDQLVAGVLLCYPTYVSRTSGRFTSAERALEELSDWKSGKGTHLPWWRRLLRRLLTLRKT